MPEVDGDTALQSDVLEGLAEAGNYRNWLAGLAVPHLGDDAIEIGSGIGDYAEAWTAMGFRVTASEADAGRLAALRTRFAAGSGVRVRELSVPLDAEGDYSAVVAYNVLEHISDDVGALRAFGRLLGPGGAVVLVVPAFPFAMSRFDVSIGHHRRYRRAGLREALVAAGLRVDVLHHVNSLGLPAWFVAMRLLRGRPQGGPPLRMWDAGVIPVLRCLESRRPPPFGQSLFAVARRP